MTERTTEPRPAGRGPGVITIGPGQIGPMVDTTIVNNPAHHLGTFMAGIGKVTFDTKGMMHVDLTVHPDDKPILYPLTDAIGHFVYVSIYGTETVHAIYTPDAAYSIDDNDPGDIGPGRDGTGDGLTRPAIIDNAKQRILDRRFLRWVEAHLTDEDQP